MILFGSYHEAVLCAVLCREARVVKQWCGGVVKGSLYNLGNTERATRGRDA